MKCLKKIQTRITVTPMEKLIQCYNQLKHQIHQANDNNEKKSICKHNKITRFVTRRSPETDLI
jgi:hypothetical protein